MVLRSPISHIRLRRFARVALDIFSLLLAKIELKVLCLQKPISRRMITDQLSAIISAAADMGQYFWALDVMSRLRIWFKATLHNNRWLFKRTRYCETILKARVVQNID